MSNNPFAVAEAKDAGLDLEPVRQELAERYQPALAEMEAQASSMEVEDSEAEAQAVALAASAKKLKSELNSRRKEITEDARDFVNGVNRLVKDFTEVLSRIEGGLKGKIAAYRRRQEMERRKAEAAARKAREEAQKRLEEEAKAAGVEPVKLPEPVVPERRQVTRTEAGTAHTQKRWTFAVLDLNQVPTEYMKLDAKAVNAAIRAGVREIPGLKIYQEERVVIRS